MCIGNTAVDDVRDRQLSGSSTLKIGSHGWGRSCFTPAGEHVAANHGALRLQPGALNARFNSAAHSATAVCASSSTRPIVMKPWIWRSKQT
jgi:hypothetical protein